MLLAFHLARCVDSVRAGARVPLFPAVGTEESCSVRVSEHVCCICYIHK